jgi:uncharacterized protein DUF3618
MAQARNSRTIDDIRRDLEQEREQLATAADSLRDAADVTAKLRAKLPAVAAGAFGAGFLVAGGIGATMRLVFRRGREGETRARFGRFRFVDD